MEYRLEYGRVAEISSKSIAINAADDSEAGKKAKKLVEEHTHGGYGVDDLVSFKIHRLMRIDVDGKVTRIPIG